MKKPKANPVPMPASVLAPKQWRISPEYSHENTIKYVVTHGLDVKAMFYDKHHAELFVSAAQGVDQAADICRRFVRLWPVVNGRDTPKATPDVVAVWRAAKEFLSTK